MFHFEAGNRSFDQRVPEELNRKVVDHLSDINMVLTEHARRYLIAEGIAPETIFKTGSHMAEVLSYYMPKIEQSDVLSRESVTSKKYFVVSAHREENVDSVENLNNLLSALEALYEKHKYPIIVSTHPRTKIRLDNLGRKIHSNQIRFIKPLGFVDYIRLQMESLCVLSDSGTITEEASLLNLPAVTIRNAHERPEGMDVGTLIMCGLKPGRVLEAVDVVIRQHADADRTALLVNDYQAGLVSRQVVRIVLSYIDYVKRTVWSEEV